MEQDTTLTPEQLLELLRAGESVDYRENFVSADEHGAWLGVGKTRPKNPLPSVRSALQRRLIGWLRIVSYDLRFVSYDLRFGFN